MATKPTLQPHRQHLGIKPRTQIHLTSNSSSTTAIPSPSKPQAPRQPPGGRLCTKSQKPIFVLSLLLAPVHNANLASISIRLPVRGSKPRGMCHFVSLSPKKSKRLEGKSRVLEWHDGSSSGGRSLRNDRPSVADRLRTRRPCPRCLHPPTLQPLSTTPSIGRISSRRLL